MSDTTWPRVAIVGAGKLGSVLGVALERAGYPVVACASRSFSSATRLADRVPGCHALATPAAAAAAADLVFLVVPDDSISTVSASITWRAGQIAVHCSGALPAAAAEAPSGTRAAGFHPLQTFADLDTGLVNLPGSTIGVEADESAWPLLATIAQRLGARALRIRESDRALYHAGAVVVSNFAVGLVVLASQLWEGLGIERADAVRALQPLLAGTARNLGSLGLPDALTGPVVRGDVGTIGRHLDALAATPRASTLYRNLSTLLIDLAVERATITGSQAEAMRNALDDPTA